VIGSDTLCSAINTVQRIDWDICLVNDSTHDSCWYGNPHYSSDLPNSSGMSFTGDECIESFTATTAWESMSCEKYTADQISAADLSSGSYSIYVTYFDGPPDSITATPRLLIQMGLIGPPRLIVKTSTISSPRPLSKGETWCAGKILIPQLKHESGYDILPAALGKTRAKR